MATRKNTGAKSKQTKKSSSAKEGGGSRGSRSSSGTGKKTSSWSILFWLGFVILFLGLFLFNRETIYNSISTIRKEINSRKNPGMELPLGDTGAGTEVHVPPQASPATPSAPAQPTPAPSAQPSAPVQPTPAPAAQPATTAQQPARQPQATQPAATTTQPATPSVTTPAPANQNQAEARERALYFIHVDRGGSILREKVSRGIPVSDSPMTDTIEAVIAGPNSKEKSDGLISLVPPNTRILSATVRGDTAYISFSEDFQYNTYGVEGYAAQLRQIVFTVTEFPNVKNVQILIEGRRVDYLGEGIWIGSPLNRDML